MSVTLVNYANQLRAADPVHGPKIAQAILQVAREIDNITTQLSPLSGFFVDQTNNLSIAQLGIKSLTSRIQLQDLADIQYFNAVGYRIIPSGTVVRLINTSGGSITLTSTPTVAPGKNGEMIILVNVGAQPIVVQDSGTLANSGLRLNATTITLNQGDSLQLRYSVDLGTWLKDAGSVTISGGGSAFAFTKQSISLANGQNDNVALSVSGSQPTWLRITGPSAAFSISGFANGVSGRPIIIENTTGQEMTILNQNAGSSAANRIQTNTGTDVLTAVGSGSEAFLYYDDSSSLWQLLTANPIPYAVVVDSITLSNGANNNVSITKYAPYPVLVQISGPSAAFSITGIVATSNQTIFLENKTAQPMTLANLNGGSSGFSQIQTDTGADLTLGIASNSQACLYYDGTISKWKIASAWPIAFAGIPNDITLANGANNDVAIGNNSIFPTVLRITGPSGAFNITGFASPSSGRILIVLNNTTQVMTLSNQNAGSQVANRIGTGNGADIAVGSHGSASNALLVYDDTASLWRVLSARSAPV